VEDMVSVELSKVSKSFDKKLVLDKVNLSIEDGEYFCLIGPSGAGKTTTLKILAGLYKPDKGKVLFDGSDVTSLEPWERGAVMMFQNPTLFSNMTVIENIMFPLREQNVPIEKALETARTLLKKIHLEERENSYPHELSGGMQQRVALARALAAKAKLLLLDEPLGALDARLRLELREELRRFAKENKLTVVHVTQDQDEAMAVGDRIALIRDGRILQVGTPSDLYLNPRSPFVMNFIEGTNFLEGYVEDKKDTFVELVIENVYHHIRARGNFEVGERVLVSIRPSALKIFKKRGGQLFARINKIVNMGPYFVIETILFGSEKLVTVETSAREAKRYRVNEIVSLHLDIEEIKVFRYPLLGFAREVEVMA
jgi:ABC-type Fe3+/spermidine/putrescine transport system ATPase subunit